MIKQILLLGILLFGFAPAYCQPAKHPARQQLRTKAHMPGGPNALDSFITQKLRYPDEALEQGIEGRSVVRFLVDQTGTISQIETVRSSGSSALDAETKRIVRAMPKWIPAIYGRRSVPSYFLLPVVFWLTEP